MTSTPSDTLAEKIAQLIRIADGNHEMGAGELGEIAAQVATEHFQAEIERLSKGNLRAWLERFGDSASKELEAQLAQQQEIIESVRPIIEYVSRGRGFVDVEPYPDALARKINGQILDGTIESRQEEK